MTRTLALVAALAVPTWAAAQEPLAVHFTAGTARPVTREENQRLEAKFRECQKTVEGLENTLKQQHGKNVETWPEAQREELHVGRDASAQAQTDWLYSSMTQEAIDDSLRDLTGKPGEKKTLRLAATGAEADLEVLVIGRGTVIRNLGWGGDEAAAEVAMRVGPAAAWMVPPWRRAGPRFEPRRARCHVRALSRSTTSRRTRPTGCSSAQAQGGVLVPMEGRRRTGDGCLRALRRGERGQDRGWARGDEVSERFGRLDST